MADIAPPTTEDTRDWDAYLDASVGCVDEDAPADVEDERAWWDEPNLWTLSSYKVYHLVGDRWHYERIPPDAEPLALFDVYELGHGFHIETVDIPADKRKTPHVTGRHKLDPDIEAARFRRYVADVHPMDTVVFPNIETQCRAARWARDADGVCYDEDALARAHRDVWLTHSRRVRYT
jgi:hypothetical protein